VRILAEKALKGGRGGPGGAGDRGGGRGRGRGRGGRGRGRKPTNEGQEKSTLGVLVRLLDAVDWAGAPEEERHAAAEALRGALAKAEGSVEPDGFSGEESEEDAVGSAAGVSSSKEGAGSSSEKDTEDEDEGFESGLVSGAFSGGVSAGDDEDDDVGDNGDGEDDPSQAFSLIKRRRITRSEHSPTHHTRT